MGRRVRVRDEVVDPGRPAPLHPPAGPGREPLGHVEKFSGVDTRALGLNLSAEQILETAAAQLPPGAEGVLELPYWTGVRTPYRDTLVGLTGSHGKAHVVFAELSEVAR